MHYPKYFFHLWALMLLALAGMGCATMGNYLGKAFIMTPEQETQFGPKVAQQVEKDIKLVDDPEVLNYVRSVGQRVWKNSPPSSIPARFYVVKDDSINAFAIPGGNIYVHTGLITAADDEAELASVIAHEAGHVIRRHGAQAVSRATSINMGVEAVQSILVGPNSPQSTQLIISLLGQGAGQGAMFKYSRQDEQEADTIAVNTLYRANYDPKAMVRFFSKLMNKTTDPGKFAALFSSHPPTRERIANVNAALNSLPPKSLPSDSVTGLRRVQGQLKALGMAK